MQLTIFFIFAAYEINTLTKAHRQELTGADHVWILSSSVFNLTAWPPQKLNDFFYAQRSNYSSCSPDDLTNATEGVFIVKTYPHPVNVSEGDFPSYEVKQMENQILPARTILKLLSSIICMNVSGYQMWRPITSTEKFMMLSGRW